MPSPHSSAMQNNEPTYGNGKICYVEIPADNIEVSSAFYHQVFGWEIRKDNHGNASFDDGVGQVSGMWVLGRKPSMEVGMLISIMVDDAVATLELITACGGKVVEPIGRHAPEITARFSDPAGNIWSLYQHAG